MIWLYLEVAAVIAGVAVLFLLSLVEGALNNAGPVALRMNLEHESGVSSPQYSRMLEDKSELLLQLHVGTQLSVIVVTILVTHMSIRQWPGWGLAVAFGIIIAISTLFMEILPRMLSQNEPERKLIGLLRILNPLIIPFRLLAVPVSALLKTLKRFYQEAEAPAAPPDDQTSEEEIQAYLEIGETEGILEKEDTRLIQSVVEFGDTLVREVMTPRTAIAACREDATMGELRDIMVGSRHSRIPIYRGDMDHIIGVAYIRQLLAHYSQGKEAEPIATLVLPALFVPETKRVSALLKELQSRGDHTAIVVDEFGGVAGMVTIEDLVEEIVGEIRDEDQAKVSEVVEDGPLNYIFRGSTGVHQLEQLTGRKFSGTDASTVAGLVASYLGRIPAPGEEFNLEGMRVRILDADRKRVRRLRIRLPHYE